MAKEGFISIFSLEVESERVLVHINSRDREGPLILPNPNKNRHMLELLQKALRDEELIHVKRSDSDVITTVTLE